MSELLIFAIFTIVNICGYGPFLILCIFRWNQYRHNISIQKRHPEIALFLGILAVLIVCIGRPLQILEIAISDGLNLSQADIVSGHGVNVPSGLVILHYINHITFILLEKPLSFVLMLRYWLIHYNVQWNKSTIDAEWMVHINPRHVERNWYLRKKHSFGNYSFAAKVVAVIIILVYLIQITYVIAGQTDHISETVVSTVVNIFPLFIIIVLYIKMLALKFKDRFYIMEEFKFMFIFYIISLFVFVIFNGVYPYIDGDIFRQELIVSIITCMFNAIYIYIQTMWVIHTIQKDEEIKLNLRRENSDSQIVDKTKNSTNELMKVLSDPVLFNNFMIHLTKEWSMEILLSLIEISQIQSVIKRYAEKEGKGKGICNGHILKADNIPDQTADNSIISTLSNTETKETEKEEEHKTNRDVQIEMVMDNEPDSKEGEDDDDDDNKQREDEENKMSHTQNQNNNYKNGGVSMYNPENMKLPKLQQAIIDNTEIVDSYIVHHQSLNELMNEFNVEYDRMDHNGKLNGLDTDKLVEYKVRLYLLFKKYIMDGSELQINISYEQKSRICSVMNNFSFWINNMNMNVFELFHLYHDISIELQKLLVHSHYRFSRNNTEN